MTWLVCGLSVHGQWWWGSVSCLWGIFLGMVAGFPQVLGFGGTGGYVHVSVCEIRDVWLRHDVSKGRMRWTGWAYIHGQWWRWQGDACRGLALNWCLWCMWWLGDWWGWRGGNDLERGWKMKNGGWIMTSRLDWTGLENKLDYSLSLGQSLTSPVWWTWACQVKAQRTHASRTRW